jgi:hypothetical protein
MTWNTITIYVLQFDGKQKLHFKTRLSRTHYYVTKNIPLSFLFEELTI